MKSHLGRRAFSTMELHTLFHGYIYSQQRAHKEQPKHWHFWLPLIACYTGAFSDEIGHLRFSDISEHQGSLAFHFNHHKKLQPRIIPVHPALIEAGFIEYLAFAKTQSTNRIFFDLPAKSGRYSEKVRIWFSGEGTRLGYVQKCQIPTVDHLGQKLAMSSFRLNFETQCRIAAMSLGFKAAFDYLMGFKTAANPPNFSTLNQVMTLIPRFTPKISWETFVERERP